MREYHRSAMTQTLYEEQDDIERHAHALLQCTAHHGLIIIQRLLMQRAVEELDVVRAIQGEFAHE